MNNGNTPDYRYEIAIIGMAGRFPGAANIDQFWQNLKAGVESVSFFSDEELLSSGVDPALLSDKKYVRAGAVLDDIESFDGEFFGFNPREAELTDPQHRLFLECAWEAFERAGYSPAAYKGSIGVYGGAALNTYLRAFLSDPGPVSASNFLTLVGNDKDYLTNRVSYKLNLRGPSVTVQTACSTSLVAVHLACQSLLSRECDMALAGGVSITVPQKTGYLYDEGGVLSPDGHCRAFDAQARGIVGGDGVGIVLLKRLADALADGDDIQAVLKGSAVNNDGSSKVGYLAPSVNGQAQVIAEALAMAAVAPETISYFETHGTGTLLGDPIEIAALKQVFRASTQKKSFCAIGSVKTNVGHLNTAAGVASLIKTTLSLRHKMIPPSLHFTVPNPQIDFADSPFYVNTRLVEWKKNSTPRRAGVSSFGFGGTNAHVVLEESPLVESSGRSRPWQLVVLSARTNSALETATVRLANHFKQQPDLNLADAAYTLQIGRSAFTHRRTLVCRDAPDAVQALDARDERRIYTRIERETNRPVVFMFPGQGSQYVNMALEVYKEEPSFRGQVDSCAERLIPYLGLDLRHVLYPAAERAGEAAEQLNRTAITQPALFVVEYALARLWMEWGVQPQAMIGHSIGEYVAACLAGVFTLEDALALVAARGRLMQQQPPGAMLSVPLPEPEVRSLLSVSLSLAAVNAPSLCVVSGPAAAVAALQDRLTQQGVPCHRLLTSHAFHSDMMDAVTEPFMAEVGRVKLQPPRIPFVSNVTGAWITAAEATDAGYWAKHLRHTVRFADGVRTLSQESGRVLLETGPGQTLGSFARQLPESVNEQIVLSSIRHPKDARSDEAFLLDTLGRLWLAGAKVDWLGFHAHERRHRVALPTYPFERQRYWVEPAKRAVAGAVAPAVEPLSNDAGTSPAPAPLGKKPDIGDWFYVPSWESSELRPPETPRPPAPWLILSGTNGLGSQVVARLRQDGRNVTVVRAGRQFQKDDDGCYTINPQTRSDYETLLQQLHAEKKTPGSILHLWDLSVIDEPAEYPGFYSLMFLAQAIGKQSIASSIHVGVVTHNMQKLADEAVLYPEKATVLGPVKVIPIEYPNLHCRSIDITMPAGEAHNERLIDQLIAEVTSEPANEVVAYRQGTRWVQGFKPVRFAQPLAGKSRLREGGVYLVTGGLGGIGLVVAEDLARAARAKLILVGRTALPEREAWTRWLESHDDANEVSRKIQKIHDIEALGASVLVAAADVTEEEEMRRVIMDANRQFGSIHGVIHAAGVLSDGLIQRKTVESASNVLQPKVRGTLVLHRLLENTNLDFFVLCSSLSSVTGRLAQVDYCAANAFLDAFAQSRAERTETLTVSVNWDGWQEVGMAAEAIRKLGSQSTARQPEYRSLRHPLLARYVEAGDETAYFGTLSASAHWVLNDHRIMNRAVFPGTAYLEIARAAFEQQSQNEAMEIRDLYFLSPLIVAENEEREVRATFRKNGAHFDFTVESKATPGANGRAQWQLHARATIGSGDTAGPRNYDIAELQAKCDQSPSQELVPLMHGPRWQNVEQVRRGTSEWFAALALPEVFAADLEEYLLHPALLDVALGLGIPPLAEGVYLPFSYDRVRSAGRLPGKLYSYVRRRQNERSARENITFDVTLMNEQGAELLHIEGYHLRRIDAEMRRLATAALESSTLEHEPEAQNFRLEIDRPGVLDSLSWRPAPRQSPGPGQVEIEVYATGLNFLDVLSTLGLQPDQSQGPVRLGGECAGKIVALGPEVHDLQIGDEVIAMAPDSFAAFATTSALFVFPKPAEFGFEEAATLPIAFLTAFYALHHVARLKAGERVLIHAAAGGVGMAAVQLAQRIGAEVFATAGSPEKRAFVRTLGVEHVMDSRSLAFADDVMARTNGKGVDVVLNSLAGEFIAKSLSTLGPHGRFVEIGKRDIYQNSPLGLRPFAKNLTFSAVDLAPIILERPAFINALLREVMGYIKDGTLRPLPHRVFPVAQVAAAFDSMARAQHIGKVIVSRQTPAGLMTHSTPAADLNPAEADVADTLFQLELKDGIRPGEGVDAFRRILGQTFPQVVVSTRDLSSRMTQNHAGSAARLLKALQRTQLATATHPRPALANAYVAARNEIEGIVADVWQKVLGIEQVGVHDNFFELGGSSLLAVQIMIQLRDVFHVELPMSGLLEVQTVAGVAETLVKHESAPGQVAAVARLHGKISQMSSDEIRTMLQVKKKAQ
jgi:acyl transferase domain-containing protein/NADPH:quinone reductase-like Zn-dependent oxidoreductase/acyl carrier protein